MSNSAKKASPLDKAKTERYVLVADPDLKESDAKQAIQRPLAILRNRIKAGKGISGGKLNGMSTWVTVVGNLVGSTATAYNTVIPIEPDNTGEFASFAALFDECKVDDLKFDFCVMRSAGAAGDTLISLGGFAYDPIDNGVYNSLSVLAEASQHVTFPLTMCPPTAILMNPQPVTSNGLYHWKAKMPPGPAFESSGAADTNIVTGLWSSTNQTNQRYGFIKPYLEAGPTGVSWTIRYIMYLHVRFRSRT